MVPARFIDRIVNTTPRALAVRCWYVRLMWPTSLIVLLVFSLPRVTTLAGMVYLVAIDVTGILAGLQGASWIRDAGLRGDPHNESTSAIQPESHIANASPD